MGASKSGHRNTFSTTYPSIVENPKLERLPKSLSLLDAMKFEKRSRIEETMLFMSQKQGKWLTRRAVEVIIEEIAKEAGVSMQIPRRSQIHSI
jgi:hypothetical protein